MLGRLAAPPVSRGCLDLAALSDVGSELDPLRDSLKSSLQKADNVLAQRFWDGGDVEHLVRARAWVVEQLLLLAWDRMMADYPQLALVAVGGFGRGELHPHSDVDLLLLLPDSSPDETLKQQIEDFLTLLWDAGFYLGHSVRNLEQCREAALEDVATATNLMESRLLAGPSETFAKMKEVTHADHMWPASEFFAAKYKEQIQRHAQFHDTAYNLEPNIKEGPGGLRDIQMIGWVAKRHFAAHTLYGLVEHGFLTESEHDDLREGQRRLWRIRYALHLLAGRGEDRLLFDYQSQIAQRFNFQDQHQSNLAVEQFMQSYYQTVMQLERLNERLLQLFQEELLIDQKLEDSPGDESLAAPYGEDYRIHHGFLEVIDETLFLKRPLALLEVFLVLQKHPYIKGVRASTVRLIRNHLYLIDDEFRKDQQAAALFLELLKQSAGVYTQLQRMNRYGLLAAYIPAFESITGRMQYDLFHVYTVDQHTLFVVRNLRRFAYGKYADQFPRGETMFRRIERPEILYLAALFHDIAKGRGGDHSLLGAEDADSFCELLPLEPADRRLVVWLVKNHLLMSQTAQRKDISDPETVNTFASEVGDEYHLDHLYLLTMADIAGTSPKLWNSWKDSLLWELYLATGHALRRGQEHPVDRELRIRETRSAALSHLLRVESSPQAITRIWRRLPEHAFLRLTSDQLEWATAQVIGPDARQPLVAVREVQERGVSEVLVHAADFRGLFAAVTGIFDDMKLNVMSARVLTTSDGFSFDLFQVMDASQSPLIYSDGQALISSLERVLEARQQPTTTRRRIPRRLRHFASVPDIQFSLSPDGEHTIMELECTDQPGLLSQVAMVLVEVGIHIHDARIATFGDHVEDTFLLTNAEGQPLTDQQKEELIAVISTQLGNAQTS